MSDSVEQTLREAITQGLQTRKVEIQEAFSVLANRSFPAAVGVLWWHVSGSNRNLPVSVFALDSEGRDEVLSEPDGRSGIAPLVGPGFITTSEEPLVSDQLLERYADETGETGYHILTNQVIEFLGECSRGAGLETGTLGYFAADLEGDLVLDLVAGQWVPRESARARDGHSAGNS